MRQRSVKVHTHQPNPFTTMAHFQFHSAYYLVIFYSFRNLCEGLK
ncbi:hypothetical protein E2C01_006249 [Portunus trituberculatus]|uniref:Uncharacterized protein n=1 Tax=Portunus trituberculatus TaxID=210409 RepID=A0A5B7D1A2_PORTR|nr:hypothetical protein [Portunus trituberculatus]